MTEKFTLKTEDYDYGTEPTKSPIEITANYTMIPDELKYERIWAIAADINAKPYSLEGKAKIPHCISVNDKLFKFNLSTQPMDFATAYDYHLNYGYNIGIILDDSTHYGVLDLDGKGVDEKEWERRSEQFSSIISGMDCYTELSLSERGYHVLFKIDANISKQCDLEGVAIYTHRRRFIVLTGNVVDNATLQLTSIDGYVSDKPVPYRDTHVTQLMSKFGMDGGGVDIELDEIESVVTDDDLLNHIMLDNSWSDIFTEMCSYTNQLIRSGSTKYPSSSEAVLAIIGALCKFTDSNEQVRRIFRTLPLSQHESNKYVKNNVAIDRAIKKVRAEIAEDKKIDEGIAAYYEGEIAKKKAEMNLFKLTESKMKLDNDLVASDIDDVEMDEVLQRVNEEYAELSESFSDIPPAHGLIGELMDFFYDRSPHKLREAAVAGALAVVSGIVGRQYRISGSALNNYFIVIAPSTMGKESASKGINYIADKTSDVDGNQFFCFDTVSSGQALRTIVRDVEFGSVTTVMSEFALLVNSLRSENKGSPQQKLYDELLDVFSKNDKTSVYGGSRHANAEHNRSAIKAPAFSIVGDCTDDLYEKITDAMCVGGFLSRFIFLQHKGRKKKLYDKNAHKVELDPDVIDELKRLIVQVKHLHERGNFVEIGIKDSKTQKILDDFEMYVTGRYNFYDKSSDEVYRQLYGRAHLKILTIASLFAVCRSIGNPVIHEEDVIWARALVMRFIMDIELRINNGEIGNSEANCVKRVKTLMDRLLNKHARPRDTRTKKYKDLLNLGFIPHSLLTYYLSDDSFRIGQYTPSKTLDTCISILIRNGELRLMSDSEFGTLRKTGKNFNSTYYCRIDPDDDVTEADIKALIEAQKVEVK